jgi:hypothetical protein
MKIRYRGRGFVCVFALLLFPPPAAGWGGAGHAIVTHAAIAASEGLPAWFREAGAALADISVSPDRWRGEISRVPALSARNSDHFFDLDVWGNATLPPERWEYVRQAGRRGLAPEKVGFLPFALLEQYGILLSAFRDARAGAPGGQVAAIAAAGALSHLVGDIAVPLHATRHHHGWMGANPRGYSRAPTIHEWFETELVTRLDAEPVRAAPAALEPLADLPGAVRAALADALAQVPPLYEAERANRSGDDGPARALVRARLAVGATLLARLWRTAWVQSGG